MENPLLAPRRLNEPVPFAALRPEHAGPALDEVLAANRREIAALLADAGEPGWDRLVRPLDELSERLSRVWGPISHLFSVCSTPEWRAAFNAGLPKVTDYGLELSQSEPLFRAYERLAASPAYASLNATQQKIVQDALRDFRLSGIGLPPEQKNRYREIAMRLSELQAKFEEHVMDAIQAFGHHVTDESELDGMSADARQQAAEKAAEKNLPGWLLTLDLPSYLTVMTQCRNRRLRETLYEAYATRASDVGPQAGQFDNGPLMEEILALRHEQSKLLGFANYAERSLATKMADSPDEVERFLLDLAQRAKPRAEAELAEMAQLAAADGIATLAPWDTAYYSERLKEQTLGLSDEALRPYFPLPKVLGGLFSLIERVYGRRIVPEENVPVWHPDVRSYALLDESGQRTGSFYLDPYARKDKRGGAWMDECQTRRRTAEGLQLPVAYLVCNFRPPMKGEPALLTHDEVLTLFHEFGHGLHLLLTQVDEPSVAGINGVEWDAVELPSQFMENWCYDRQTLSGFARHYRTGEPLPEELLEKLRGSRVFQSGLSTVRQLEFALFDLRLHRDYDPARGAAVLSTLQAVRREVAVIQPPAYNRMPWSFGHIFAGGYAAGYYSYKWAEVLSADAFAAFEETDFSPETGHRFRDTILANGGSRRARELFEAFRGREPSIEPLLRHSGLLPAAA